MKIINKIGKVAKAMLLGIGLAYITSCGGEGIDVKIKNNRPMTIQVGSPVVTNRSPMITTNSLENAVAGEYYKEEIDVYDEDGDELTVSLVTAPEGMNLKYDTTSAGNNYYIEWSPIHSNIGPNYSQTGSFPVEISVTDGKDITTKTLDLLVTENSTALNYLRSDENIKYMCKEDCAYSENYLYQKVPGIFNIVKIIQATLKSDAPERYKPLNFTLVQNSTPEDLKRSERECIDTFNYIPIGSNLLCIPKKSINCYAEGKNCDGFTSPWASGPDAVEDQILESHEYTELVMFNGKLEGGTGEYNVREGFVTGNSATLTDFAGQWPGFNSFGDSRLSQMCNYNNYKPKICLMKVFWDMYTFDMGDMSDVFKKLGESTGTDTSSQNFKCIFDSAITKKIGVQTNTYDAFEYYNTISGESVGTIENNSCEK